MTQHTVKRFEASELMPVTTFMKQVMPADGIDRSVLENAVLAKNKDSLSGMVSFEKIDDLGVIRYFIYGQQVQPDLLVNMFFELYANAKSRGVSQLVSITTNPHAFQLFELLGFAEVSRPEAFQLDELETGEDVRVMSIKL